MKLSVDIGRPAVVLPLLVLVLALAVRVYWMGQKETLYGDELTSLCLAYDQPGWGSMTFEAARVYTGKELRSLFYMDDRGGVGGLWHDLAALHDDNRDPSHASLYYMALRCALASVDRPDMARVVRASVGLNLLFFMLSFLCLWRLLWRLFPGRTWTVAACLFVAGLNPASVSATLLVREYQMAEWMSAAWALWCVAVALEDSDSRARWLLALGVPVGAGLISTGYFNIIFWGLMLSCLAVHMVRRRAYGRIGLLCVSAVAAVGLAVVLYGGYFNFLNDVRTAEVAGKAQGGGFFDNLVATVVAGAYILVRQVLTPVGMVAVAAVGLWLLRKGRRQDVVSAVPCGWLFGCAWLWAALTLLLATWKFTRYVAPSVPLLLVPLVVVAVRALAGVRRSLRLSTAVVFAAAFTACTVVGCGIDGLEPASSRPWPRDARRVLLYGPDDGEKNTLNLLIPCLSDSQQCVIAADVASLRRLALPGDSVYVYGAQRSDSLLTLPGLLGECPFNPWMSVYVFRPDAFAVRPEGSQ